MIGPYRLARRMREVGCGTIWMAEQMQPVPRRVALKIIETEVQGGDLAARLELERRALALMEHPNIARVLDGGTTPGGRPYVVTELVDGIPITQYCDQNGLTTAARLALFEKACLGVQHAHAKGVVHGDLTPCNVLVSLQDGEPVPRIIDFGVARATHAELNWRGTVTDYRSQIGTPLFMSPEQAETGSVDIDTRSDVYSLGAVLCKLLAGTPPFTTEQLLVSEPGGLQRMICEDAPVPPSVRVSAMGAQRLQVVARKRGVDGGILCRQLRGDLDWIVMRALEKERARRYPTVEALVADLRRHAERRPLRDASAGASRRVGKLLRRQRTARAAAGTLLLAIVASVVVTSALLVCVDQVRASATELRAPDRERSPGDVPSPAAAREHDRAEATGRTRAPGAPGATGATGERE